MGPYAFSALYYAGRKAIRRVLKGGAAMKKLGMLAVVVLVGVMAGCSICSDIGTSFHESNSTSTTLKTSIEKLNAAVPKAAEKAGYTITPSTSAPAESLFEGKGIEISTKKLGDNQCKVYIRTGFSGDRDKESLILKELKKELGL
jgi:hypothetical protein